VPTPLLFFSYSIAGPIIKSSPVQPGMWKPVPEDYINSTRAILDFILIYMEA
jgi:hypothetical protein